MSDELLEELRALRRELRELRHGPELVARLSAAERDAIARRVLDGLDERFAAERAAVADHPPQRTAAKRRRYFQ